MESLLLSSFFEAFFLEEHVVCTRKQFDEIVTKHWMKQKRQPKRFCPLSGPANAAVVDIISLYICTRNRRRRRHDFNSFVNSYWKIIKKKFSDTVLPSLINCVFWEAEHVPLEVAAFQGGLYGHTFNTGNSSILQAVGDPYEMLTEYLYGRVHECIGECKLSSWSSFFDLLRRLGFRYDPIFNIRRVVSSMATFSSANNAAEMVLEIFDDNVFASTFADDNGCSVAQYVKQRLHNTMVGDNLYLSNGASHAEEKRGAQRCHCASFTHVKGSEQPNRITIPIVSVATDETEVGEPYVELFCGTSAESVQRILENGVQFRYDAPNPLDFNHISGMAVYFSYDFEIAAAWARQNHSTNPSRYAGTEAVITYRVRQDDFEQLQRLDLELENKNVWQKLVAAYILGRAPGETFAELADFYIPPLDAICGKMHLAPPKRAFRRMSQPGQQPPYGRLSHVLWINEGNGPSPNGVYPYCPLQIALVSATALQMLNERSAMFVQYIPRAPQA